jgi:hypothetical protein
MQRLEFLIDTDLPDSEASMAQSAFGSSTGPCHPRSAVGSRPLERHLFERGVIEEIIAEGIVSGEFVVTDASPVAAEFLGLLEGLGLQVCLGDVQMPVEICAPLLRNLLRASAAGAPARRGWSSTRRPVRPLCDREVLTPGSGTPDLRSRRWFDGFDLGYSHRGWLRHNGFSDEALRGRP